MASDMADVTPPRRDGDDAGVDYRALRRPISGNEVQLGVGKYSLTLRGSMVISVVAALAILAALWFIEKEMVGLHQTHALAMDRAMRLQACVLSLSREETTEWRASRDTTAALLAFCPSLMLPTTGP